MVLLSVFRLPRIRKLFVTFCLLFSVSFILLSSSWLPSKARNLIRGTFFHSERRYPWDENIFDMESYLKLEEMEMNDNVFMAIPAITMSSIYKKVEFIPKELSQAEKYYKYSFNIEASHNVPLGRKLPDSRHPRCKDAVFERDNFLSSSIIITFHNEARSALLRTISSILMRTPASILEEIILVDDHSDNADDALLLSKISKVKVIRNERTEGVAQSRVRGAQEAEGEVLIFMDSHCEVNVGWMEPLVELVTAVPKALVSPALDRIDKDDFEYEATSTYFKGGFDWALHFKWIPLTSREKRQLGSPTHPFWSPVVAAGIFAVSKDWFFEIGAHDNELEATGAEDIEISLKSWLCGGSVYICPCSRVGNVFRNKYPQANHSSKAFIRNAKRVAEVWLDDYKIFFYEAQPSAYDIPTGSLEQPQAVKDYMDCKSFRWYLEGLYPELKFPTTEALAFGQIKQGLRCLTEKILLTNNYGAKGNQSLKVFKESTVHVEVCDERSSNQQGWTYGGRMKSAIHKSNKCLTVIPATQKRLKRQNILNKSGMPQKQKAKTTTKVGLGGNVTIALAECNQGMQQKWKRQGKLIYHDLYKKCLEICQLSSTRASLLSPMTLCLGTCSKGHSTQQWEFSIEVQPTRNKGFYFAH
ncbi:polypeptide N-acetylgalactosaminyltransferase 16-like [Ischnura elegans]|uniref:polypeptide N-acetylgalactosaminyltransferase 16-like n=1 Tax=Ischnura elegans TaxID=197161 RepID=UPI001ED8B5A8|nr:polypeptide N-acetylgalactosaminyltransferase 16-like [Ischnura elegans]